MAHFEKPVNGSQPQGTVPMTVAGGNRNALNLPLDAEGKRDWSYSILGCFGDMKTCCLATWCPCLAYSRNKRRFEHLETHGIPDPERDAVCGGDGWVYSLVEFACDLGWVLQMQTRKEMRRRYNLKGSAWSDCFTSLVCEQCDLVQVSRELELEENSFGSQYGQAHPNV
ncbi:PLAC8-domain-containing protein [Coprinopsis marcescibilis]|uniref:PLAC8-domain-containing protein n=1 Tax=Coprinopsis marcescibilis TaxID=230819 RepID=A0A5C3KDZ8_COPMA|nr:PLAC8-domain-containing protein [Coprinopsis marcescibilis]